MGVAICTHLEAIVELEQLERAVMSTLIKVRFTTLPIYSYTRIRHAHNTSGTRYCNTTVLVLTKTEQMSFARCILVLNVLCRDEFCRNELCRSELLFR